MRIQFPFFRGQWHLIDSLKMVQFSVHMCHKFKQYECAYQEKWKKELDRG